MIRSNDSNLLPMLVLTKVYDMASAYDEDNRAFLLANIDTPLPIGSINYYAGKISHVSVEYGDNVATVFYSDVEAHIIWVAADYISTYLQKVKYPSGRPTKVDVTIHCVRCERPNIVTVNDNDLRNYRAGNTLAQVAFPYLSADQRELFISGICGQCFDKMFKAE